MNHFSRHWARFWRVAPRWFYILATIAIAGCLNPNFMTGGATDKDYTIGYDIIIKRERRGLPPPPEQPLPTWNSYWCQIIRSLDSPPPSAQKARLKGYLIEKRRAYGLGELNCR